MNDKQKIVAFMKWKQERITKAAKKKGYVIPNYFTKEDEADINSMQDDQIRVVIKALTWLSCYYTMAAITDSRICPYCIVYFDAKSTAECSIACGKCPYGVRHGYCTVKGAVIGRGYSDYKIICDRIGRKSGRAVCTIIGRKKIKNKLEELFGD